ncbi:MULTISPECIES: hypothetical protein [unclassified Lentimonas]|uniref:hypothetical protein n=1 Tax=unclassified Lentimonas TaxID=2630993 RepID=UPI001329C938|nr:MULTISPECIES: hypothetical protein [unclassified Lentimonas]CAA6678503.1 Unannotated [Lentimonas sp. CC4]CAA6685735.1 Unannotated [Lentimonas sp. CC6]CAA7076209.1 Unannotated [Lentimonas sp. CC4]CAA7168739.1 Unannotated [Lentimonas sp. CC21]CAA7183477.1 Unannotated [Lentimonas sp. CC8]
MNTKTNTSSTLTAALALGAIALFATACGPKDQPSASQAPSDNSAPSIQLLLTEAPANALSVANARAQAKPGESIQVRGQIGGTRAPFVDGYAGFVLADPELEFCNEMGDDHCTTPWDACCEDKDKLKAMRVSVQFVDASGNPIQQDLKATIGLKEQDTVAVTGTVTESSTPDNVIIHATALYKL